MNRLEQLVVVVGSLLVVAGVTLAYPPAGVVTAGVALIVSTFDLRPPRRTRT